MARNFGIHGGLQDRTLAELRRLWSFVDQAGFDWLSVWDHLDVSFFGSNSCFEALSALTLIAAETTRVRIGCLVFCINYRHPGVLAKALITIDHASNGWLEVGLGAGWHELEYDAYGIPFPLIAARQDQLEESIQIIRSLLTQQRTTFSGRHFQLRDAICSPKPLQERVPLWIGGVGEKRTLRTAARYADGWDGAFVSPEVFHQKNQLLDQWCEKEQRDPASLVRMANLGFHLTADPGAAKRERERFRVQWGPMAESLEDGILFGTPREAIDRIGQYFDAGAARVVLDLLQTPLDWKALQGFVEEVMPAFR
jgi:alkanesulfonate monooxygenase SsuD/methylene tetrahydromethanopterin reductase-like flavin-dependent oxidoreductase (luciferase family)